MAGVSHSQKSTPDSLSEKSTRDKIHLTGPFCPLCDEFMEESLEPIPGRRIKAPVYRCVNPRCEHTIPRERKSTPIPETGHLIHPSTGGGGRVDSHSGSF